MSEDLLDYWVRLITPIFPTNAWIVASYSGGDHLIQIDWKLGNDSLQGNKRSRKIQIIIKEDAIDDYLDKNKDERELYNVMLKQSICGRYDRFNPDNDAIMIKYVPMERWLVSKDILNALTIRHKMQLETRGSD
jgi:hypothetical protein